MMVGHERFCSLEQGCKPCPVCNSTVSESDPCTRQNRSAPLTRLISASYKRTSSPSTHVMSGCGGLHSRGEQPF